MSVGTGQGCSLQVFSRIPAGQQSPELHQYVTDTALRCDVIDTTLKCLHSDGVSPFFKKLLQSGPGLSKENIWG